MVRSPRSFLYVPGDRPDRLAGAAGRGADALIADLEDAVPVDHKQLAREAVRDWLAGPSPAEQRWVRVNGETVAEDIAAVVTPGLTGVVVPKAELTRLLEADAALARQEHQLGCPEGTFALFALVETARGLLEVTDVARAARVRHVGMGEADLAGELRLRPGPGREELRPLRLQVVVACAAAGIGAPTGPTSTDVRDVDGLRRSTEELLRLGFRSRTAIHPDQLAVVNDTFTPTAAEVSEARGVLERFEASEDGVFVDERGRLVDAAVVRSAREVLDRAEQP
ncbi:MAG: CoA ester lyase [Actinomycetota bacterium]|nr:CoA ester lyase [Actinomycetota bacterium]